MLALIFYGEYMNQDIWHLHLLHQDRMDNKDDISLYASDEKFRTATSVLDIGTGYGHHIFVLANAFPEKRFIGMDIDPIAIQYAQQHYKLQNLEFIKADIENHEGLSRIPPQDYIIARLLVQHLSSVRQFAHTLSDLLTNNGALLVVDVNESSKQFYPAMPEYKKIFLRFREWQLNRRNNEEVSVLPIALKERGFLIKSEVILSKSTDTFLDRDELYSVLATNLSVLEEVYGITGDYEAARSELQLWHSNEAAYGSLADYILRATKV